MGNKTNNEKTTPKVLRELFLKTRTGAALGDKSDRLAMTNLLLIDELRRLRKSNRGDTLN